jgi:hypothetical protein
MKSKITRGMLRIELPLLNPPRQSKSRKRSLRRVLWVREGLRYGSMASLWSLTSVRMFDRMDMRVRLKSLGERRSVPFDVCGDPSLKLMLHLCRTTGAELSDCVPISNPIVISKVI